MKDFTITIQFSDRIENILREINVRNGHWGYQWDIDWNLPYLPMVGDDFDWVSYVEDIKEYKINEISLSRKQYEVIDNFRHNCFITQRKWVNSPQQKFKIKVDVKDEWFYQILELQKKI